jgi:mRNA-degrading endonuclease RelE of RelBE toxin-antitoxin system
MSEPDIQVVFTPLFTRFLKHLSKKYHSVRQDVTPFLEQLEAGEIPGDQVSGVKYTVYKVRVKNSDVPKGKSGGYRVIYYLKTAKKVILLAIYAKTERVDIPADEIRRMVEDFESK